MSCAIFEVFTAVGGHLGEYRLLGYKTAVHTSQETHHVSATESSQLLLCKIWGSRGRDYEECRLLGYDAVWLLCLRDMVQSCWTGA
jgi:hypothetical protein